MTRTPRRWMSSDDTMLEILWQEHKNLALCAELMNKPKSLVYASAARLKLGEPPRQPAKPPRYEEKQNPLAVARWILGARLTETPGCFLLDGTPATLATVMKAANRELLAKGMEPFNTNHAWVVRE